MFDYNQAYSMYKKLSAMLLCECKKHLSYLIIQKLEHILI